MYLRDGRSGVSVAETLRMGKDRDGSKVILGVAACSCAALCQTTDGIPCARRVRLSLRTHSTSTKVPWEGTPRIAQPSLLWPFFSSRSNGSGVACGGYAMTLAVRLRCWQRRYKRWTLEGFRGSRGVRPCFSFWALGCGFATRARACFVLLGASEEMLVAAAAAVRSAVAESNGEVRNAERRCRTGIREEWKKSSCNTHFEEQGFP